jgi:pentatricopeptide repeat domain-containing protein 1
MSCCCTVWQGAQWVKAAEVFAKMQSSGCKPDVVTYTALVSAYERGGQWMKALEVGQQLP